MTTTATTMDKDVYAYSVYTPDWKTAILQIKLSEFRLYLHQNGVTKRHHSLLLLHRFTSSDLTLRLDFLEGELVVNIDNYKDKAAIFDLLSLVLARCQGGFNPGKFKDDPIKTGDLEKKGEMGVEMWNSRRVKVSHGRFSYQLPGEENVMDVVELWKDTCWVQKLDDRSFFVSVSGYSYSFRLCNRDEEGNTADVWIQTFTSAMRDPNMLTEKNIRAAVVGTSEGQGSTVSGNEGEDTVDFPDPAVAGAFILNMFSPKTRAPSRPPTEDEEFVMIELKDLLKCRSDLVESFAEEGTPSPPKQDPKALDKQGPSGVEIESSAPKEEESHPIVPSPPPPGPQPPAPPSSGSGPPPPPPPPPPSQGPAQPSGLKLLYKPEKNLKQAHWSKVPPTMLKSSLWHSVEDVSCKLNLEKLDSHFSVKENKKAEKSTDTTDNRTDVLLDHKRAQIVGIVLGRPYRRALDRLRDAITSITEIDVFGVEKLRAMKKLVPTADDIKLYKSRAGSDLLPMDEFMLQLCSIPHLEARVDLAICTITFPSRCADRVEKVSCLKHACGEVLSSQPLKEVLGYLRAVGNYLNGKRLKGYGVHGFLITSVDKVFDIKNVDTGYSVMDYLLAHLQTSHPELVHWPDSLKHVSLCADLSMPAVEAELKALREELARRRCVAEELEKGAWNKQERTYFSDVKSFLSKFEVEVASLTELYERLTREYAAMLEYLGEPPQRKSDEVFSAIADFMRKFINVRDLQSSAHNIKST
ncbi:disheveled-associated activator of morphogenesis 1-A-like [Haliotis rufescens]|uniref:disheveled-associated activator of morphogenesis 1-A-like n=1 Tax=Haliotis rufescens TaxID=6454 RepID=UPI00201F1E2C|nr:disheveled-associated activator of morphogenesis 1-A-like [Haliotis rufescens]XP_046329199.2 disheveled-associated activator of morphogenesis 1-A-like [Haliotis rufescens]XP_046329200.2 disheveled-associated activator of morphogenesis 1-A-like [Haliotis rufescens]